MGNVRRVYVEKKPDFAVKAKELKHEVKHYLGIAADQVRVLIRYDVENVSDATYQKALQTVFSEPPVDDIYEENFDAEGGNAGIILSILISTFCKKVFNSHHLFIIFVARYCRICYILLQCDL